MSEREMAIVALVVCAMLEAGITVLVWNKFGLGWAIFINAYGSLCIIRSNFLRQLRKAK